METVEKKTLYISRMQAKQLLDGKAIVGNSTIDSIVRTVNIQGHMIEFHIALSD